MKKQTFGRVRTVDVYAAEYWDKRAGNTYFSARAVLDFGLPTERTYHVATFQYGYGDHFVDVAADALKKAGMPIPERTRLWQYCREKKIILRTFKTEVRTQRELKNF